MFPTTAAIIADARSFNSADAQVIVTQSTGDAVLVWNAGDLVLKLKNDGATSDAALAAVERAAAQLLIARAASLTAAHTVSIKVIYPRNPEFNAAYKVEVVSGMERLVTLKADRLALQSHAKDWNAKLDRQQLPGDIAVAVTAKMPW